MPRVTLDMTEPEALRFKLTYPHGMGTCGSVNSALHNNALLDFGQVRQLAIEPLFQNRFSGGPIGQIPNSFPCHSRHTAKHSPLVHAELH